MSSVSPSAKIAAIICVVRRRDIKMTLLICDSEGIHLCENKSETMPAFLKQAQNRSWLLTAECWLMGSWLRPKSEIWTVWWIFVSLAASFSDSFLIVTSHHPDSDSWHCNVLSRPLRQLLCTAGVGLPCFHLWIIIQSSACPDACWKEVTIVIIGLANFLCCVAQSRWLLQWYTTVLLYFLNFQISERINHFSKSTVLTIVRFQGKAQIYINALILTPLTQRLYDECST